ncbi:short-chain dehydrogenase [Fusarium acutatum]|uniref:Short-chain dehydrogenase n=1 Tax=Fusarium acutatum TaxID=78861 RepID=A0A8H4JDN4_9HYPO|nr:short-chain dehydrogenase [Fusarium acutatum]
MTDKVIVVTGAGNGIGLAIVKKLLHLRTVSHVVAVDLKAEKLELIQEDNPQKLHIVVGDVCQENTNIEAVETAIRHGGRLTTLILNAATYRPLGAFPTLSLESWKHAFNINFFSNIHMAVLNYLCGCIPLEDSRISSVAITPGAVDTEMQSGLREEGTASPEVQKFLDALKAEGRLLKPEEPAVAFAKLVETGIPKDLNGQTVYWEDIL